MANTIIPKKSSVVGKVPLTTDLQVGELAFNLADKKIFSKDASGTVVEMAPNTGGVTDGDKGDITVSGSGATWTLDPSGVTAGSYTSANITVDAKGRVTAAANGSGGGGVSSFSAGTTGLTPSTATTGAVTLGGTLAAANGGTGVTNGRFAKATLSGASASAAADITIDSTTTEFLILNSTSGFGQLVQIPDTYNPPNGQKYTVFNNGNAASAVQVQANGGAIYDVLVGSTVEFVYFGGGWIVNSLGGTAPTLVGLSADAGNTWDIPYTNGSGAVTMLPLGTAGQVLTANGTTSAPTFSTLTLENLPDAWVKRSVRVATTANITLSGTQTIDGRGVVAGDRVLVKNQSTSSGNGIYVVASGTWSRAADANTASEISGATVAVDDGVTNGGKKFTTTFDSADSLGSTAMPWFELGGTTFSELISPTLGSTGSLGLTAASGNPITFTVGVSERARVSSAGFFGIGTTNPLTNLEVDGHVLFRGDIFFAQPTPASKSAAATLTGAEILGGIVQYTGSAATLTMPTASAINTAIPFTLLTDHAFEFIVINTGSGTATMALGTGITLVGTMTVTAGTSARFRVRKSGSTAYVMYRV